MAFLTVKLGVLGVIHGFTSARGSGQHDHRASDRRRTALMVIDVEPLGSPNRELIEFEVPRTVHLNGDAATGAHRGSQLQVAEVGQPISRSLRRGGGVHHLHDLDGEAEELQRSTARHLCDGVAASRFRKPQHRVRPANPADVPPCTRHSVLRQLADHRLEVFEIECRERRVAGRRSDFAASSDSRS